MLVKIHNGYRMCVAVCDSDLIDKKFEEGERQLDLSGTFFKGDEKSRDEVKDILINAANEDASFNIVGPESVKLAKELGIVKDSGVFEVEGVEVGLVLL